MTYSNQQELLDHILELRGVKTKKQKGLFFNPQYTDLSDPFLLPDMEKAVARIVQAKERSEKVCIYGDYDVDGITATTVLMDAFSAFGIDAFSYIPDRFSEGYGMSVVGVKEVSESGADLIITVDCGSKSHKEIEKANSLGVDVIVTDHHTLAETLPQCIGVVNPKRSDSKYPFKDLAGVGVGFMLVRALQTKLPGLEPGQEKWLLDLVALGTTCDVVSMTGENRILSYWGIQVARKTRRPGLDALSDVSRVEKSQIKTEDFGFRFGPRLNASGRLKSAELSLELLQSQNRDEARSAALELDQFNSDRRAIQNKIAKEVSEYAETSDDDVLVVANEEWSHGVVGIVAAKTVERYKKPTFVMQIMGEETKGSARSYGDFNLAKAIDAAGDLVVSGGGHALAAGVKIKTKDIDAFREAVNDYYQALSLGDQATLLSIEGEVELDNLELIDIDLIDQLGQLEPFGKDNEPPLFEARLNVKDAKPVGSDETHLKVTLEDDENNTIDGIGFGLAKSYDFSAKRVRVVFSLSKNEFRGETKPQLMLRAISKN